MSIIYKNGHYYGQGGSGGASGGGLFTITVSTQSGNTYAADATPLEVADAIAQDYVLVVNFEMYHTVLNLVSADTASGQYIFSNEYTEGTPDSTALMTVVMTKSSDIAWGSIIAHSMSGLQLRGEISCGTDTLTENAIALKDFDYDNQNDTDIVSPHLLTAGEMAEITSTLPGAPVKYQKYSTTEQVVGEWIDGRPVYEKTVDCGALPNKKEKTVAHGIDNLDYVISMTGIASNGINIYPLPWVAGAIADQTVLAVNNTNIRLITATDRSSITTSFVTLRYIKTTD